MNEYDEIWDEYCSQCKCLQQVRWLECEEHGCNCNLVICCVCGEEIVQLEKEVEN